MWGHFKGVFLRCAKDCLNLKGHVKVIRDTSEAPKVQLQYKAWTQLREYMRALDKYVGNDFIKRLYQARILLSKSKKVPKAKNP
jgi:hypothetical protein